MLNTQGFPPDPIIGSHTAFWGMSAGQMNVTKPGLLLNMAL